MLPQLLSALLLVTTPPGSQANTAAPWSEVASVNMSMGPSPAYKEMISGGGKHLAQIVLKSAPESEAILIITGYGCDSDLKHFSQQMIFHPSSDPSAFVAKVRQESTEMLKRLTDRCGAPEKPISFEGPDFETTFLSLFAAFERQRVRYEQELAAEERGSVQKSGDRHAPSH